MRDLPQEPHPEARARYPRLFHGKPPEVCSDLPVGWRHIVDRLMRDIDLMLDDRHADRLRIGQIKEKLAGSRLLDAHGSIEIVAT